MAESLEARTGGDPDLLRVSMFVHNNYVKDSRVRKEVRALTGVGHRVTVFALIDKTATQPKVVDGAEIVYLPRDPIHLRVLSHIRNAGNRRPAPLPIVAIPTLEPAATPVETAKEFGSDRISTAIRESRGNPKAYLRRLWNSDRAFFLAGGALLVLVLAFLRLLVSEPHRRLVGLLLRAPRFVAARMLDAALAPLHRPLVYLDFHRRCKQALEGRRADVYQAHDLPALPIAAWAAERDAARLVYDSHELFVEAHGISKAEKAFLPRMERRRIRLADQVFTVSESIADELAARYDVPRPLVLLNCPPRWNAKGPDRRLRERLQLEDDVPLVLYLGGFSPNRGLSKLVAAFTALPGVHLAMMGWGTKEQDLRTQAQRLGIDHRVHFLPPAPYDELLAWSSSADVGVIPYRATNLNNYYSCPNKLFEYIGAGLAVAASDFPELRRHIRGHDLGSLFDPDDPADIARALAELLGSPERLAACKAHAREARTKLNWDVESRKLIRVYERLAREGRKPVAARPAAAG